MSTIKPDQRNTFWCRTESARALSEEAFKNYLTEHDEECPYGDLCVYAEKGQCGRVGEKTRKYTHNCMCPFRNDCRNIIANGNPTDNCHAVRYAFKELLKKDIFDDVSTAKPITPKTPATTVKKPTPLKAPTVRPSTDGSSTYASIVAMETPTPASAPAPAPAPASTLASTASAPTPAVTDNTETGSNAMMELLVAQAMCYIKQLDGNSQILLGLYINPESFQMGSTLNSTLVSALKSRMMKQAIETFNKLSDDDKALIELLKSSSQKV